MDGRGDHWSPAKKHKVTFPLSYFSLTKSTKSQQGGLTPSSLQTSVRRARVSRASHAWRVCAAKGQGESRWFCRSPQLQLYHACEHSARKSRADSCTHCLHARIIGLAGVDIVCSLTEWSYIFYFGVSYTWILCVGRWLAAAAKKHKDTFSLSRSFSQKSTTAIHLQPFNSTAAEQS